MSQQPSAAAWVKLPAAVVLVACEFLDADELGRLEMCGRQSLGDGARAWKDQMSRIHRGNLATLPPKKFLAAHTRAQALYPSTADVASVQAPIRPNESVSFDEFSFTVVLTYYSYSRVCPITESFHLAAFEYMRITGNSDEIRVMTHSGELRDFKYFAPLIAAASPKAQGQSLIAPWLREAAQAPSDQAASRLVLWCAPTLTLICTRRSDGAAIKVAVFDSPQDEHNALEIYRGRGILYFDDGELLIQHGRDVYDYHMVLEVAFDEDTGRVEAFCGGVYHSTPDLAGSNMSNEMLYALLHARLDESMRA